jgi:hypothetical protein
MSGIVRVKLPLAPTAKAKEDALQESVMPALGVAVGVIVIAWFAVLVIE